MLDSLRRTWQGPGVYHVSYGISKHCRYQFLVGSFIFENASFLQKFPPAKDSPSSIHVPTRRAS